MIDAIHSLASVLISDMFLIECVRLSYSGPVGARVTAVHAPAERYEVGTRRSLKKSRNPRHDHDGSVYLTTCCGGPTNESSFKLLVHMHRVELSIPVRTVMKGALWVGSIIDGNFVRLN